METTERSLSKERSSGACARLAQDFRECVEDRGAAPVERSLLYGSAGNAMGQAVHHGRRRQTFARLLKVSDEFPRRLFLPAGVSDNVSNDEPVRLGEGSTIPPIRIVTMMLGALELDGTERVLDIGCGSGYQAALLSRLTREVVSIEIDDERFKRASRLLKELGCANVQVIHADGSAGWPQEAPYQGIVVGAAATELPAGLIEQLDLGGRMVIPLGDGEAQLVERLEKRLDALDCSTIGACRLDMLVNPCRRPSSFPWTRRHSA
jgi:protein-L-isoaspartate(D-aspartate) O-methyltransferase